MRELKAEKIRGLDEAEIEAKIKERNEELFHLRFRNQVRQLTNPVLIRERRRDIARLMTVLAEMRAGKTAAPAAAAPAAKAPAAKAEPAKSAASTKAAKASKSAKPAKAASSAKKEKKA